jgi:signal transduction histidine kinase
MSLPESRMPAAWCRAERSSDLLAQLMSHIVEPPVLAQQAAALLRDRTGLSFVGLALRDGAQGYAMHGVAGARHPGVLRKIRVGPGEGHGAAEFMPLAAAEGLRAMTALPILSDGDVVGLLYGATRGADALTDGAREELESAAAEISGVVGAAVRHTEALARQAAVQRERIAQELHDSVGPILFAIGVSARSLPSRPGARIGQQVGEASRVLRAALRTLGRQAPQDDLPVAARIDIDAFTHRSGIPAQLAVLGEPRAVGHDEECVLLAVLRAALHNVEEHADADLVVVTLRYGAGTVQLVIQDDGVGLPEGFVLRPRHGRDRGWGVSSMLRRVQQHGGRLEVRPAPDRGTIVRAELRGEAG